MVVILGETIFPVSADGLSCFLALVVLSTLEAFGDDNQWVGDGRVIGLLLIDDVSKLLLQVNGGVQFASNQSASIQVKLQVLDAFGYWCSGSGRYAESGVPLLKLLKDGVKPLLMFRMSA